MTILVCQSTRVLLPGNESLQPASVYINRETGKIIGINHDSQTTSLGTDNIEILDVGDKIILPGLVDAHVHLNEPGRSDWEGFWTGTQAAASGGVTTVVDMPLNSIPPTVTVPDLELKRQAAQGQCFTDVAFWAGVIPGNASHLKALVSAGVKGFKCFLIDSGVQEFPCVSEGDLRKAMPELENLPTVLLFHAELDNSPMPAEGSSLPTSYSTFLQSRPEKMETDAISLIIKLQADVPGLRCHIVHLSAASALPMIRAAKASGANLTVETCFHYLCLAAEDIPPGHPEFKCCPPIREQRNRDLLWEALKDGTIDCVVSDHSPCVVELKKMDAGDIMDAWGGISTLGLGLSLLWTEGYKRGITIADIIKWTSVKTAEHAGLESLKGKIEVGYDADIVIWDPDAEFEITKEMLKFKNRLSPYEGQKLRGRVEKTFLRGNLAYDCGAGNSGSFGSPSGLLI